MIKVISHINKLFTSVSYIVFDDESRDCWIIDVGDYAEIKSLISDYKLKGVFLTHTHFDHIYGLNFLLVDYPSIPVYTNINGQKSLYTPSDNLSVYHDENFVLDSDNVVVVKDGDKIEIANSMIHIYETPGHDYSCITYKLNHYLFTGDAYIPGVRVFTKLQNGNKHDSEQSLIKIHQLATEDTILMPGHNV